MLLTKKATHLKSGKLEICIKLNIVLYLQLLLNEL